MGSSTKVCYNGVGKELLESDEGIILGSVVSPLPCEVESVLFLLSSQTRFTMVHFTADVNSASAPECGVMVSAPLGESRLLSLGALTGVKCYLRDCNTNLGKWKPHSKGDYGCF